jgi:glycosyltransferase involved in cell wall biosynthesis
MSRVAIASPCLLDGDAVSNDVRGMRQALLAQGHDVGVFVESGHDEGPGTHRFSRVHRWLNGPDAVLIYHHSIGWQVGLNALRLARCKRVVKYHNVTPPEFFENVSHQQAAGCREGRAHLSVLASAGCDRYLSDSAYNMGELVDLGASRPDSSVVPPFHNVDKLQAVEADLDVLDACRDGMTNILMVGRVAPNKGHRALIDAFAVYHHEFNHRSRLLIVGKEDPRLGLYSRALRLRILELGITHAVVFTGPASNAALKSYYLSADAFVITSQHEGFCVPLIEAMAMKVPIVALGSSAVPATVGDAGLVWEEANPALFAESIHRIVVDDEVRTTLGELGRQRYRQHFTNERIEDRLLHALEGLL